MVQRILILSFIIFAFGCTKQFDENLENDLLLKKADIEKKDKTKKKGIGMSYGTSNWSSKVSALEVEWHYSWGYYFSPKEPENLQYVPMDWGGAIANNALTEYLEIKKETGEARYVLGFNEPDGADQANMSVEEALRLWPKLEQVGLPLGSPATVNPENDWMKAFMAGVEAQGLRVDFVCVHHYGGINAQAFLDKLQRVYHSYGKPIWVTEFAVADWQASSPDANRYSPEQVLEFMQTVLPALDTIKYIERYAWFPAKQSFNALTSSALFDDETGELTTLGQYYAHNKHNSLAGSGKDDYLLIEDPENLVLNGNFETGDASYWGGYNSKTVGMVTTLPHRGEFLGQVNAGDGSLLYELAVTPGKTYNLSAWYKWKISPPGIVNIAVRNSSNNALIKLIPLEKSTNWAQVTGEFVCPEDVQNIKIVVWKPQKQNTMLTPELYLDDVVCK